MQLFNTLIIALVGLSSLVLAADPKLNEFKTARPSGICKGSRFPSDGTQVKKAGRSTCSSTIQGQIPDVTKMVSTTILYPENEGTVKAGRNFTAEVLVSNLRTGFFSDAVNDYYDRPQELKNGIITGHSHITIQKIKKRKQILDPTVFAFFKGLNLVAQRGVLTQVVNLPPGYYRMCTMASSFTHQPVLMPVAQRGAQDDCIRFRAKK